MAAKATTIVVNITKEPIAQFPLEASLNEAKKACFGMEGEYLDCTGMLGDQVLDAGETYIITKKDGKIAVIFYNNGEESQDIDEKITLTCLDSHATFVLEQYQAGKGRISLGKRRANLAGILETMFQVPPCSMVFMIQE